MHPPERHARQPIARSRPGVAINSGFLNGKKTAEAITAVCQYAEQRRSGSAGHDQLKNRMPRLADLRQRYWGADSDRVLQERPSYRYRKTTARDASADEGLPAAGHRPLPLANVPDLSHDLPKCGGSGRSARPTRSTASPASSWYSCRFASRMKTRGHSIAARSIAGCRSISTSAGLPITP